VRASDQYSIFRKIEPQRGTISWQDISTNEVFPLVVNRTVYSFYIVPKAIKNPEQSAHLLSAIVQKDEKALSLMLNKKDDPYELVESDIPTEREEKMVKSLEASPIEKEGYGFEEGVERYYLGGNFTAHITGFVGFTDRDRKTRRGVYGLEEYYDTALKGKEGIVLGEKDAVGRPIPVGKRVVKEVENGSDIELTLDKNIQHKACAVLNEGVKKFDAVGGAVIVMDPKTGYILALCGNPDFDPNQYGKSAQEVFVNPAISKEYEPGSVFKPITMAAALDMNAITPLTTYHDTGFVKIDKYTIRNFDGQAHGINTMVNVLENSLNTGAIFAMRSIGQEHFKKYVNAVGFGKLTGLELAAETDGDVTSLNNKSEIYAATASYGQGIAVTPIQLVAAYATIARGGVLIKPTLIKKMTSADTLIINDPREADRVISEQTAKDVSLMLVSVVKNGYDNKATVKGYKIAGKTGTAQISRQDDRGYGEETNQTFAGFGPVSSNGPVFVILIRLKERGSLPIPLRRCLKKSQSMYSIIWKCQQKSKD
jgi:cell division protein FtsI/penicillin-binding protein 2